MKKRDAEIGLLTGYNAIVDINEAGFEISTPYSIGNRNIKWRDIVGLREIKMPEALYYIPGRGGPHSKIYLDSFDSVTIPHFIIIKGDIPEKYAKSTKRKNSGHEILFHIARERGVNINPVLNNWVSWRMYFPLVSSLVMVDIMGECGYLDFNASGFLYIILL